MNDNNKSEKNYSKLMSDVQGYYESLDSSANCCSDWAAEEAWIKCYKE